MNSHRISKDLAKRILDQKQRQTIKSLLQTTVVHCFEGLLMTFFGTTDYLLSFISKQAC